MADEVIFAGQSGTNWRYWTNKPLGTPGGFGGVFEAEGSGGAPMAVKVVAKSRPGGPLDDRLLRREIEIGRRVGESDADLLLAVVDAAETADSLLLVMHRADGGSLADLSVPLGELEAVEIITEIAKGLQQLHAISIIHRDLKPANVLRHSAQWKLADFGIARDQEVGTQNPTFVGWGSPPYMAPELWRGLSPTPKSDLYALGCLATELLTGATPYVGDAAAQRSGHVSGELPLQVASNVVLNNLIRRLLAKTPGERPQDARAVVERLQRVPLPLSPGQQAIARGLAAHTTERSREAAQKAEAEAAAEIRRQQVAQARGDLQEIFTDALEELHAIEPGATLHQTGSSFGLATDDATLQLQVWDVPTELAVQDDTMILAGCALIKNRRNHDDLNAANVVYEQSGDRLAWHLYRFSSSFCAPDQYRRYGPWGRTHGLSRERFFDPRERGFMIHPVMHVWKKDVGPLDSSSLLGLFREAVELTPPDPRRGF
jgi:hypothetical protein